MQKRMKKPVCKNSRRLLATRPFSFGKRLRVFVIVHRFGRRIIVVVGAQLPFQIVRWHHSQQVHAHDLSYFDRIDSRNLSRRNAGVVPAVPTELLLVNPRFVNCLNRIVRVLAPSRALFSAGACSKSYSQYSLWGWRLPR